MGLFSNPLGHAGYPANTVTAQVLPSEVRAATAAEASAGVLTNVYISPATEASSVALDFASPPVLGFGSTTPRPVHATTLSTSGLYTLGEGSNLALGTVTGTKIGTATSQKLGFFNATPIVQPVTTTDIKVALVNLGLLASGVSPLDLGAGALGSGTHTLSDAANIVVGTSTGTKIGTATSQKLGFFNATPIVQPINTTDLRVAMINLGFLATAGATPLDLNGGSLTALGVTVTAPTVAGASPVVNNSRAGQASFTDTIANGAYGVLTITNSTVTSASVILAVASCVTGTSAVQVVGIVPTSGSVAITVFNAGASSTAANININYSVLN